MEDADLDQEGTGYKKTVLDINTELEEKKYRKDFFVEICYFFAVALN